MPVGAECDAVDGVGCGSRQRRQLAVGDRVPEMHRTVGVAARKDVTVRAVRDRVGGTVFAMKDAHHCGGRGGLERTDHVAAGDQRTRRTGSIRGKRREREQERYVEAARDIELRIGGERERCGGPRLVTGIVALLDSPQCQRCYHERDDEQCSSDRSEDEQPAAFAATFLRSPQLVATLADPGDEELARDLVEVEITAPLAVGESGGAQQRERLVYFRNT